MNHVTFTQLVDIERIRHLLEAHFKTTGLLSAILDTDENILVAVGWQEICTRFHRVGTLTRERCRHSDARIKACIAELEGDYLEYQCDNGLQEVAMPIVIEGVHLATFFIGQFFYDDARPDPSFFRNQARESGFDEESYLAALDKVPILSRDNVRDIMDYYRLLVQMMSETGLKNLKLTREVEERKRAEKEASFFRALIEYTRDPVYVLDPSDGCRMVYVNQAACSHFGMDRDKLLTMRIPDWDPTFDMDGLEEMWRKQKEGKSLRFETVHRVATGGLVPVEVTANYLVHDGKELAAGYFYDISKRKAMEASLRESERNLVEAQRIARIGNWMADTSGTLMSVSAECCRIFGVAREDFGGTFETFLDRVHPDDQPRVRNAVETLVRDRLAGSMDCRIIRPDGDDRYIHVEIEHSPEEPDKPDRIVGTVQDVTEQREVMEALREKDLLLLQQSRLATMGEMVNYIAHQWRQPLNVIGLLVQAMKDDYLHGEFDDDSLHRTVEQVMNLIRHMSATIDDFREFFRSGREPQPFNLKETTGRTLSFIEDTLKMGGIRLTLDAEESLVVSGYPNEYSHVLLNMLNNAREALIERRVESPRIDIRLCGEDGKGIITVRDNAGGIPPQIIGKLFESHVTTKERGTGIGLYMSKTIIEKRMHGTISAVNTGEGAEFRIEIPLVDTSP